MKQQTIDNFMKEYKRLCDDFGMSFQFDIYDQLGLHDDVNQEEIDCRVNLEGFTATMNKPYVPTPKMLGPMTKEQFMTHRMMSSLRNDYMSTIVKDLNTPSVFEKIQASKVKGEKIGLRYGRQGK